MKWDLIEYRIEEKQLDPQDDDGTPTRMPWRGVMRAQRDDGDELNVVVEDRSFDEVEVVLMELRHTVGISSSRLNVEYEKKPTLRETFSPFLRALKWLFFWLVVVWFFVRFREDIPEWMVSVSRWLLELARMIVEVTR